MGMLIFLNKFLRQPVTILGELVQREKFCQTSGLILLSKKFFLQSVFKIIEID